MMVCNLLVKVLLGDASAVILGPKSRIGFKPMKVILDIPGDTYIVNFDCNREFREEFCRRLNH
jgi:hypothetical protein